MFMNNYMCKVSDRGYSVIPGFPLQSATSELAQIKRRFLFLGSFEEKAWNNCHLKQFYGTSSQLQCI